MLVPNPFGPDPGGSRGTLATIPEIPLQRSECVNTAPSLSADTMLVTETISSQTRVELFPLSESPSAPFHSPRVRVTFRAVSDNIAPSRLAGSYADHDTFPA